MRVLIVGAGTIGASLAASLAQDGQNVVVVDQDPGKLARLDGSVDCQTQLGNAISPLLLEEIGIRGTDMVVAVTESDAINMTVCRLAAFYGVPRKLARVRIPEFSDPDCPVPSDHLGIDHIISPEGLAVDLVERLVRCPGAREALDFENGRLVLRALLVNEDSPLASTKISEVAAQVEGEYIIAAIRRGGRLMVPNGSETIRIGDTVYVLCPATELANLVAAFNPSARPARRALIYGGDLGGRLLAARLGRFLDRVILIEEDQRKAEEAANVLQDHHLEVLHGSPLDEDLLTRCDVAAMDFFVALTNDDENNLMAALLFRRSSSGTPVVLTNRQRSVDILESIDLDIVINPRALAVSALLRYLRPRGVVSAARLLGDETEIGELRAGRGSRITRSPLRDLDLDQGILVAAVVRGGSLHIPRGSFQVQPDDRVLVISPTAQAARVGAFFH